MQKNFKGERFAVIFQDGEQNELAFYTGQFVVFFLLNTCFNHFFLNMNKHSLCIIF